MKDLNQFLDMDRDEDVYYIPHHAANSNKFRVVFDGSVKTSTGFSLNDILLNGPRVQEDLTSIIMRFRTHRIALTTDITKMYRQIRVPADQRDYLRIIWRTNENEPLRHYRLKTKTYGLKSSAYCCIETLRHCAFEYKDEFPLASKAVLESFYVDDGTLGAETEAEAEELYRQLNLMLSKGGFPLAKWATNNKHMQKVIGTTAKSVNSVAEDSFRYDLNNETRNESPTKPNIVAAVAQQFDPNGWISPIIIKGKILIQDLWKSKCEWDTTVSQDLQTKWHEFSSTLMHLTKITIPRWIRIHSSAKIQIH